MLPEDETFLRYYSLAGLYERLREDAALYPDTMDQRYGAWGQLLVLFRMIHDGAECSAMRLPKRHGVLFDPDRFKFLEGRTGGGARQIHERIEVPLVPDGTIYRALEKLLVLDGERISYRALDVEQIGSVYETMMGFRLETATGPSVAIKAQKKQGAPTARPRALLAESAAKREKWIQTEPIKITDTVVPRRPHAEDLHAALLPVSTSGDAGPRPGGAMVLQPSESAAALARTTRRALTGPIVRTTLGADPAHARADGPAAAGAVLASRSATRRWALARLVEACRQLGDALVEACSTMRCRRSHPMRRGDLRARLIAQRCLYGVDKNRWRWTWPRSRSGSPRSRDMPLFLDHSLAVGTHWSDRKQIAAMHWQLGKHLPEKFSHRRGSPGSPENGRSRARLTGSNELGKVRLFLESRRWRRSSRQRPRSSVGGSGRCVKRHHRRIAIAAAEWRREERVTPFIGESSFPRCSNGTPI
jgi:hypothetical protein